MLYKLQFLFGNQGRPQTDNNGNFFGDIFHQAKGERDDANRQGGLEYVDRIVGQEGLCGPKTQEDGNSADSGDLGLMHLLNAD